MPIDEGLDDLPEEETLISTTKPVYINPRLENLDVFLSMNEKFKPLYFIKSKGHFSVENKSIQSIEDFLKFEEIYVALSENLGTIYDKVSEYMETLIESVEGLDISTIEHGVNNHIPKGMHIWLNDEIINKNIYYINKISSKYDEKQIDNDILKSKLSRINYALEDIYNETDVIASKISANNLLKSIEDFRRDFYTPASSVAESVIGGLKEIKDFLKDKEKISFRIDTYMLSGKLSIRDLADNTPKPAPVPVPEPVPEPVPKKTWWRFKK
jgi:hypothetical protein